MFVLQACVFLLQAQIPLSETDSLCALFWPGFEGHACAEGLVQVVPRAGVCGKRSNELYVFCVTTP